MIPWLAAARMAQPWWSLLERRTRFLQATWLRPPAEARWSTGNRVIAGEAAYRLREFPTGREAPEGLPVLVVPPEVNQSTIVDYAPGQSFVQALIRAGFARVAAIEWLTADPGTKDRDIDHSIQDIHACIQRLGGRVHLVGLCQGGWESAIVAARRPSSVATLTLVASPVDFHAGAGPVRLVAQTMPMTAYQALVKLGGGVMKGEFISAGFDNLLPLERYVLKYLSVWNHLDDAGWMERFHRMDDWYRCPKDLPGPMYLRCVKELFKENRLVRGCFRVLGETVDLGLVTCPLALVAGKKDHITPPAQVWAARKVMRPGALLEVETDGGHVGTFMGRTELARTWPGVLAWLQGRAGREIAP